MPLYIIPTTVTETLKTLAQNSPAATVLTDLYTVPASTSTAITSVVICNHNSVVEITFRISIAIAGGVDDPKQYIYYDMPLSSNDTFVATIGLKLATTDVIRVYTNTANVSFSLFGTEIS